jgi:hypothetical protein
VGGDTILCRPFRAVPVLDLFPGVETPGLVLQSLRDKFDVGSAIHGYNRRALIFGSKPI